MNDKTDDSTNWGSHAPCGLDYLLLLARKAGLSHGVLKKMLARIWLARHPETPVDITYHGARFRLHPWDNVTDTKLLFGSRDRDRVEIEALRKVVNGGGVFVDVGADIGFYSLMAAIGGTGRVIAIEPNPPAYDRLAFNIAANGFGERVTAVPVALGAHSGQATLFVPEQGDIGGSRISAHKIEGKEVRVQLEPLTGVLEKQGVSRVTALKIDVEGREDDVLFPFFEQARHSLWPQLVIIEHTSGRDWQRDILAWMIDNGYREVNRTRSNAILQLDNTRGDAAQHSSHA